MKANYVGLGDYRRDEITLKIEQLNFLRDDMGEMNKSRKSLEKMSVRKPKKKELYQ